MTAKEVELEARITALEKTLSFSTDNPGGVSRAELLNLKELILSLLAARSTEMAALKELIFARFTSIDKSLEKTAQEIKDRFTTVNEFRATLSDQATTFVTKDKFDTMCEALRSRIETLEKERARSEGKASTSSVYISYIFIAISIAIGVIGLLLK